MCCKRMACKRSILWLQDNHGRKDRIILLAHEIEILKNHEFSLERLIRSAVGLPHSENLQTIGTAKMANTNVFGFRWDTSNEHDLQQCISAI